MNGIINLNKPAGMTSHDAVNFIRRLTGIRKVGHTGTLDPMATGVLPVCIGKATRLIEFMEGGGTPEDAIKSYRCEMKLGLVTDTLDIWGIPLAQKAPPWPPSPVIRRALAIQIGRQRQIPPIYSAIKFKGKKLYEYARAGEEIPPEALKEREVVIHNITVNLIDEDRGLVAFDVDCSRGTYVRSLCHEVGQQLGCGAVMCGLSRLRSGVFTIEESHTPESLEDSGKPLPLLPVDCGIASMPAVALASREGEIFRNGCVQRIQGWAHVAGTGLAPAAGSEPFRGTLPGDPFGPIVVRVYVRNPSGRAFIGIGQIDRNELKPIKVITI